MAGEGEAGVEEDVGDREGGHAGGDGVSEGVEDGDGGGLGGGVRGRLGGGRSWLKPYVTGGLMTSALGGQTFRHGFQGGARSARGVQICPVNPTIQVPRLAMHERAG